MSDQNALGVSPSASSSVNTSSSPKPSLTEHKQQVSVTAPGPLNLEICKSNIEFIKYPWNKLHDRSSTQSTEWARETSHCWRTLNNVMISIWHWPLVKFVGILTWLCVRVTDFLSFDIVISCLACGMMCRIHSCSVCASGSGYERWPCKRKIGCES